MTQTTKVKGENEDYVFYKKNTDIWANSVNIIFISGCHCHSFLVASVQLIKYAQFRDFHSAIFFSSKKKLPKLKPMSHMTLYYSLPVDENINLCFPCKSCHIANTAEKLRGKQSFMVSR